MRNKRLSVTALLERLVADFLRRRASYTAVLDRETELLIGPPESGEVIATFDPSVSRPLSPMLEERFAFAGSWEENRRKWLALSEIGTCVNQPVVREWHESMRERWDRSAPMKYPDCHLSLFGVSLVNPDWLEYLVWVTDDEPEVWLYNGTSCSRSRNLAAYLRSWLKFD